MQDRQITLTRLIAASPHKVWQAWTDPALLPRWFGPEGYSCRTIEIDLREGGIWRFDMIGPDGTVWPNRHRYTRAHAPHRLEFLLDGDDDDEAPILAEIILTPEAGGTRITQTLTFPSAEARNRALAFGADKLGQTTLAKLAAIVESAG